MTCGKHGRGDAGSSREKLNAWTAYNVDKKGMARAYAKAYIPALWHSFGDEWGPDINRLLRRSMEKKGYSPEEMAKWQRYVDEWKIDGGRGKHLYEKICSARGQPT